MMIETEEEYNSVVKLTDFLVDMVKGEEYPASVEVLFRLIQEWEDKNVVIIPEKVEGLSLNEFSCAYKIGDKSRAICHECKLIVNTTFKASTDKDYSIAGYCDECGTLVSIPHQTCSDKTKDAK